MKLSKGAKENLLSGSFGNNILNSDKLWKRFSDFSDEDLKKSEAASEEIAAAVQNAIIEQVQVATQSIFKPFTMSGSYSIGTNTSSTQSITDRFLSNPPAITGNISADGSYPNLPVPSGVSQKDAPVVSFMSVMFDHPLKNEKVWTKIGQGNSVIYKMSVHALNKYKAEGKMKMNGIAQDCLPHPIDSRLIILGTDFMDGFVLDDDDPTTTLYWRIQCKATSAFFEILNF